MSHSNDTNVDRACLRSSHQPIPYAYVLAKCFDNENFPSQINVIP